jgi:hypothetical protein
MLPAGSLEAEELELQFLHFQATTSCKHSLLLLKKGEVIARNMLS